MHMFPDKQTAKAKNSMWIPKRLHKGWFLELGPLGGRDIQGEGKGFKNYCTYANCVKGGSKQKWRKLIVKGVAMEFN